MTEQDLRSLLRRRPEEGFRAFFDQYYPYVYTIVWNRLCGVGSREDAEECISDVFADAFAHFDAAHEGNLRGWLATLANRTAIDAYRRLTARAGKTVPLEEELFAVLPDDSDLPAETERAAAARQLLDAVTALGEPDSTIIMQKYYHGRRSADIAAMLGMRPTTVRSRLSRALRRLREMLKKEDFF